jgi:hypothetical protein
MFTASGSQQAKQLAKFAVSSSDPPELPSGLTFHIYLHICQTKQYLLIPWSRDLLEQLTGFQLVKKFPTFSGTQRFFTAFTSARHLSLA